MIGFRHLALLATFALLRVDGDDCCCTDQTSALESCLTLAGYSSDAQTACEACISDSAGAFVDESCEKESSDVCENIPNCPCGDTCDDQVEDYATCLVNERRETEDEPTCPPLDCNSTDIEVGDEDPPSDSPTSSASGNLFLPAKKLPLLLVASFVVPPFAWI